jgi:hypothetical protein
MTKGQQNLAKEFTIAVACVFFPDGHWYAGKHCPDPEMPHRCRCHSLYHNIPAFADWEAGKVGHLQYIIKYRLITHAYIYRTRYIHHRLHGDVPGWKSGSRMLKKSEVAVVVIFTSSKNFGFDFSALA